MVLIDCARNSLRTFINFGRRAVRHLRLREGARFGHLALAGGRLVLRHWCFGLVLRHCWFFVNRRSSGLSRGREQHSVRRGAQLRRTPESGDKLAHQHDHIAVQAALLNSELRRIPNLDPFFMVARGFQGYISFVGRTL